MVLLRKFTFGELDLLFDDKQFEIVISLKRKKLAQKRVRHLYILTFAIEWCKCKNCIP